MVKYRDRLFGGSRHVGLIDPDLTWSEFVPAEARALWRKMADRHMATRGEEFGVRAAEGVIDSLYSVAAWFREEQRITADTPRPPTQWRKAMKEEWAQRTGKRQSRPYRPRHMKDEYRRIFAALNDSRVDPRIRLAIELAAECRTGQVLQCTRRALALPGDTPNDYDAAPPGSLDVSSFLGPERSMARLLCSRRSFTRQGESKIHRDRALTYTALASADGHDVVRCARSNAAGPRIAAASRA